MMENVVRLIECMESVVVMDDLFCVRMLVVIMKTGEEEIREGRSGGRGR